MSTIVEAPLTTFRRHAAEGRLAYQVSVETGRAVFYPRLAEPGTGAALEWRISSGKGTVHATTVLHHRGEPPMNLALIELDEGFRMMSRVEDCPPDQVHIGQRVNVRFAGPQDGGPALPVFVPAEQADD